MELRKKNIELKLIWRSDLSEPTWSVQGLTAETLPLKSLRQEDCCEFLFGLGSWIKAISSQQDKATRKAIKKWAHQRSSFSAQFSSWIWLLIQTEIPKSTSYSYANSKVNLSIKKEFQNNLPVFWVKFMNQILFANEHQFIEFTW